MGHIEKLKPDVQSINLFRHRSRSSKHFSSEFIMKVILVECLESSLLILYIDIVLLA